MKSTVFGGSGIPQEAILVRPKRPLASEELPEFDQQVYIDMLVKEGFEKEQATGLVELIQEALQETIAAATLTNVAKEEQLRTSSEMNQDLDRLRQELELLEKQDFSALKAQIERITEQVTQVKSNVRDEIVRIKGGVLLDINLYIA